jgi:hypothetical protein
VFFAKFDVVGLISHGEQGYEVSRNARSGKINEKVVIDPSFGMRHSLWWSYPEEQLAADGKPVA